jgi:transposase-like protein
MVTEGEEVMSTSRSRRRHPVEEKVTALKRHHLQKEEVSKICEDLKLSPSLFYTWQRDLFGNASAAFTAPAGKRSSRETELGREIAALKERLAKKDAVIAEISAEYVDLKKELGEP